MRGDERLEELVQNAAAPDGSTDVLALLACATEEFPARDFVWDTRWVRRLVER